MRSDQDVARLLPFRPGHYVLESGHHGDLWLDLESLFFRPALVRRQADTLAERIAAHAPEVVCGPLVEGAFVALMAAERLALPFTYAEPWRRGGEGLFPVGYRLPPALRPLVNGRRVAIVNDVINAGSAVRGTLADLRACGAQPAVIATLAVLGDSARRLADENGLPLETLCELPNRIWRPDECALCAQGLPLTQ